MKAVTNSMCAVAGRAGSVSDQAAEHGECEHCYCLGMAAGGGAGFLGKKRAWTRFGIAQTDDRKTRGSGESTQHNTRIEHAVPIFSEGIVLKNNKIKKTNGKKMPSIRSTLLKLFLISKKIFYNISEHLLCR